MWSSWLSSTIASCGTLVEVSFEAPLTAVKVSCQLFGLDALIPDEIFSGVTGFAILPSWTLVDAGCGLERERERNGKRFSFFFELGEMSSSTRRRRAENMIATTSQALETLGRASRTKKGSSARTITKKRTRTEYQRRRRIARGSMNTFRKDPKVLRKQQDAASSKGRYSPTTACEWAIAASSMMALYCL